MPGDGGAEEFGARERGSGGSDSARWTSCRQEPARNCRGLVRRGARCGGVVRKQRRAIADEAAGGEGGGACRTEPARHLAGRACGRPSEGRSGFAGLAGSKTREGPAGSGWRRELCPGRASERGSMAWVGAMRLEGGCRWKSRDRSDNWRSPPGNRRSRNGSSLGGPRQECAESVLTGARILKDDRCLNAYEN